MDGHHRGKEASPSGLLVLHFAFSCSWCTAHQWCMCGGYPAVPRSSGPSVTSQPYPGLSDHHLAALSASYPQLHPTCSMSPPTSITCLYPRRLVPACLATVDQLLLRQASEAATRLLQWVLTSAWGIVPFLGYSPRACFRVSLRLYAYSSFIVW